MPSLDDELQRSKKGSEASNTSLYTQLSPELDTQLSTLATEITNQLDNQFSLQLDTQPLFSCTNQSFYDPIPNPSSTVWNHGNENDIDWDKELPPTDTVSCPFEFEDTTPLSLFSVTNNQTLIDSSSSSSTSVSASTSSSTPLTQRTSVTTPISPKPSPCKITDDCIVSQALSDEVEPWDGYSQPSYQQPSQQSSYQQPPQQSSYEQPSIQPSLPSLQRNATASRSLLQDNALVLYIQMAYCGNRTLNNYLEDPARVVKEEEILQVCVQLGRALEHIHCKHIIHRDVKPANIFYNDDGVVRLGDFGLSRDMSEVESTDVLQGVSSSSTMTNSSGSTMPTTTNIGTFIYASPEQFTKSAQYDTKSDIYSAGMVLYEMTYPAFKTKAERYFILDQPRNGACPESRPGISLALFSLIMRMLARDPTQRPSATEVVAEASMILEGKRKLVIQLDHDASFSRYE